MLFCLTERGERCGEVSLPVGNTDWEDIAIAEVDGTPFIYVGDIGDNTKSRATITVYRFAEPEPGQEVSPDEIATLTFRYPAVAQDAEAMFVDPEGTVYIVSKGSRPVAFAATDPSTDDVNRLRRIGVLPLGGLLPGPTAADLSADGSHVLFATYGSAYEYEVTGTIAQALRGDPLQVRLPPVRQREAIAYSLDGSAFFSTSEGMPMPLYRSRLRP
jgi:hypothetical protein